MKYLGIGKALLVSALLIGACVQAEEAYKSDFIKHVGTNNASFNGNGVTTDNNGNVFVAGQAQYGFAGEVNNGLSDAYIAKYNNAGVFQWARQFGLSGYNEAKSVATDSNGNIFIAGTIGGVSDLEITNGANDAFVAKYSSDGSLIWNRQFGSSGRDFVNSITVDKNDNLIITGGKGTYRPGYGVITKYSNDGSLIWMKQFGYGLYENAMSSVTDSNNNIYVTGYTGYPLNGEVLIGGFDAVVIKYSSDGDILWTRIFGTAASDKGISIDIDTNNNLLICGETYGTFNGETSSGSYDGFISKYNSDGLLLWNKQFGTSSYEYVNSITTDSNNNIFIAGTTGGTLDGAVRIGNARNAFLIKYSRSGIHLWNKQFGTPDSPYFGTSDTANSITVDNNNNILLTGSTYGSFDGVYPAGSYSGFLAKFSSPNTAPVASATATPQIVILNGTTVELDASKSYDEDGDNISYKWSWIQKPENSTVSFSDENSVNPIFTVDEKGDYTIDLEVTDSLGTSSHIEILVSFNNIKPIADAGVYTPITVGQSVYLDGKKSSDANIDALTYNWTIVSKPQTSVATITNSEDIQAMLSSDVEGTYIISLTVNDGTVDSEPANVTIEVITVQTATTQLIEQTILELVAIPDSSFVNSNQRKALINKLNVIVKELASSKYTNAMNKLQNDILPKVDGYVNSNQPDKTDWIVTPIEQSIIHTLIAKTIEHLQNEMN